MTENPRPLVSILIPLYNQKRYINACIQSVCKQTYNNLEIIVVNDGSTDDSPQMVKGWAEKDNRIKVIDKPNEGLAFARRDGYLAATGEFVTFLDSDDMLPSQAIEILLAPMLENNVDLVLGIYDKMLGFYKRHNNVEKYYTFPFNKVVQQPALFDKYYVGFFRNDVFPVSVCAKLYRKSVIDKAFKETDLYSDEISFMGEDQYFNLKLFPYLHSMYRVDKVVYYYRYGGGTFGFNRNFPQLFVSSDKRLKMLDKFDYSQGYKPLFDEYVECLYYHAAQLIHFKILTREEVIEFFKHEMKVRELMPRLVDYYTKNGVKDKAAEFLCSQDFDGMYDCAFDKAKRLFGSVKYKLFKFVIKSLSLIS